MDDPLLVVGLGNPGPQYASTRHNVGQMVLDALAARLGVSYRAHKAGAVVAEARLAPGGPKLLLAKPGTYMNLSGRPVAALARFYKTPPSRIIAVHDDLDLEFDTVRIKSGGGHGGHNGLRDLMAQLATQDFVRVRVGIGRPPGRQDAADYVLHDFGIRERRVLPNLLEDAADAIALVAEQGVVAAQNVVNQRG